MFRHIISVFVFCGLCCGGAIAQERTSPRGEDNVYQDFLASDFMERMRRQAVQRSMALHQPECFELPELELLRTELLTPFLIAQGAQVPNEAIWREQIVVQVCEETSIENVVHAFSEEGQSSFLLARGRSLASVNTQINLIGIVVESASRDDAAEGCDVARISDTYVSEEYSDGRWQERWEVSACDRRIDVDVTFTPVPDSEPTYEISVVD